MPMSFNSMFWFDIISECLHVMHSCSGFRHSIARCLLERLKSAQCHSSAIRRCVSYVFLYYPGSYYYFYYFFFRTQLGLLFAHLVCLFAFTIIMAGPASGAESLLLLTRICNGLEDVQTMCRRLEERMAHVELTQKTISSGLEELKLKTISSGLVEDQLGIVDQMLADGLEVCAKQTKLTLSHVVEELERECIDNQVRDQVRKALDFISTTPRDIAYAYDLVLAVTNKRMNMHFKICKLAGCGATDLFQPLVGGI